MQVRLFAGDWHIAWATISRIAHSDIYVDHGTGRIAAQFGDFARANGLSRQRKPWSNHDSGPPRTGRSHDSIMTTTRKGPIRVNGTLS
jgi:hypothetical protein